MQAQKLHKQHSAPLLNLSAIRESTEEIVSGMDRYNNPHNYNPDDYAVNNSKFMRVEPQMHTSYSTPEESEMDFLMDGFGDDPDKRRGMFASQKSATSIIDEAKQAAPAWFNRSCPNLANPLRNQPGPLVDRFEEDKESYIEALGHPVKSEWHHSQPNLFSETWESPIGGGKRPNLLLNRMKRSKMSQSDRHLTSSTPSHAFDMFDSPRKYHSPQKRSGQPFSQEDIVLSPIGDGSTLGLWDKLSKIEETVDRQLGEFTDPLPF